MKLLKLLFLSLTLLISTSVSSQCPFFSWGDEDMTFSSQQDIDDFFNQYPNCTSLPADITIEGSSITNLNGLQNIADMWSLTIINCPSLTSLNGLSSFTDVGDFIIENNDALVNLNGLGSLVETGFFTIINNDGLQSLTGLDSFTKVRGNFTIENNNSLQDLDGLNNFSTIIRLYNGAGDGYYYAGVFYINNNDQLLNLNGLDGLAYIGRMVIDGNIGLQSLTGIGNLGGMSYLSISNNPNLQSLDGMQSLTYISGTIGIINNNNLQSLEGLNNIQEVEGNFYLEDNDILTDVSALNNCGFIVYWEDVGDGYRTVSIKNNLLLSCCDPFCSGVQGITNAQIENNAPGCNAYQELSDYCDDGIDCLVDYYAKITAQAFLDYNQNGIQDNQEPVLDGIEFEISPQASYIQNGQVFYVLLDTYQVSYVTNSNWQLTTPASLETTITDIEDEVFLSWGLTPNGEDYTVSPTITSSITRCNNDVNFWLDYENLGNIESDGTVSMTLDPATNFIIASPTPENIIGNTLYWSFENLIPFQNNQIHLQVEMPGVDAINQELFFSANVDVLDANGANVFQSTTTYSSVLVCAYDPNDKLVQPDREGDENYTTFDEELTYTVRFQNTGNDTAFVVVIEDQLDANLDLNTLRLIGASHDVETELYNNGLVKFIFNDILLVDSTTNEPGSHGFVKYKIKPLAGLSEFTPINNFANIFFDVNPAIVTNTTTNTLVEYLCPSLSNVGVDIISGNIVRFSWDTPYHAKNYLIRYREQGATSWITIALGSDNFTTFNNLNPNTTYEYQIQTDCNNYGSSLWSSSTTFTTGNEICDRPINLNASNIGTNGMDLTWGLVSNASKYKLRYALNGTENWTIIDPVLINTYTLDNLVENTLYDIGVKAKCTNGWTNWTESITALTSDNSACSQATNINFNIISGNVVRFDWTNPSNATNFTIRYRAQGNSSWINVLLGIDNFTTLNNLIPNTTYEYQFQTDCAIDGLSPWTALDTFKTTNEVCDRPENSSITQISLSSVQVQWDLVPNATKYKIYYGLVGEEETVLTLNDVSTYVINGLTSNTSYRFSIKAKCTDGWTNWTEEEFFTMTDIPEPCDLPTVTQEVISGNVVKLSWLEIDGAKKYRIRYKEGASAWIEIQSYFPLRFINDLEPNISYEAQIKTVCNTSASAWSSSFNFTTTSEICDRPNAVTAFAASSSAAVINWTTVTNAEKFRIKWKAIGTSEIITLQNNSTTSHNLNNLNAGTEYRILIKSKCSGVWTNYTQPIYFTTLSSREQNPNEQLLDQQLSISPNPFSNQIQVRWTTNAVATIELYNTLGQLVKRLENITSEETINTNGLENGTYILKIEMDGQYSTRRIVKYN